MANPDKIRKIKSYNPHGFTGGETPSPSTITLYVRNSNGNPVEATAVPVVEVIDAYWLAVNLKDFDFEVSDVIGIDDQISPCPEYAEQEISNTTPVGAPGLVDPEVVTTTTTTTTTSTTTAGG